MDTFKDKHKIQIMLSKKIKGKAPPEWTQNDWKQYHKSFSLTELTPYHFAAMVWQGYGFTPVFSGRRKESNFVAAWHLAFDFDSRGASLDFLMREGTTAWLFSSFAYSTPSSTAEHPKSRVVFIFDEPLTDSAKVRQLYKAMAWRFEVEGSLPDPQCKDPLRLYYGSPNCNVVTNWSMLNHSTVDLLIPEWQDANPPPEPSPIEKTKVHIPDKNGTSEKVINSLLDNIVHARDGEKHGTLNKTCYVLGGYVAGGYLSEMEAVSKAEAAIRQNGRAKDIQSALRTIETAVRDGQTKPLTIDVTYKKDVSELL